MLSINLTPGTIVDGRYKVIESVGDGGMGKVFKARELGLERIVALKVLHSTLVSDGEIRQRFAREGKVLSELQHPNILTLYRIGMWEEHPYIAMEFLEGQSLRNLLRDGAGLSVERVIDIGVKVCTAMEYAHGSGILHRDLKPDNIMLVEFPATDSVKVVDFGLATLLTDPLQRASQHLTQTGGLVGSIHYMSPEQCLGKKADVRSDIYSLGCLLYEAIVCEPPLVADNPIGMMRLHVEVMPAPMSERLDQPLSAVGMDTVLMRAMAKDPNLRYQSMRDFKTDLKLVLDGKGQEIISHSAMTQCRQFSLPMIWYLPLLILLPICAIFGVSIFLRQSSSSISSVLPLAENEEQGSFKSMKASDENENERSKKRRLVRILATYGVDHLEVAKAQSDLAEEMIAQGRFADAELLVARALRIREHAFGPDHTVVAEDLFRLGDCKARQQKLDEAEPLLKRGLRVREKVSGPEHLEIVKPLSDLGHVYFMQGKYDEAVPRLNRCVQLSERPGFALLNADRPLSDLTTIFEKQKKYAEAEPLLKRWLQIREKVVGSDHLFVAVPLLHLAEACRVQGKYAEAEPLYRRCSQIVAKAQGGEHPDVATPLFWLAVLYRPQGKYAEAEPLFSRCVQMQEKALGAENPVIVGGLAELAGCCERLGKLEEAEKLRQRVRAIQSKQTDRTKVIR